MPRNESISIQVVHGKGPFQLLFQFSPRGDREGAEKFSKVDGAVAVGVERSKDVLRKFGGVAVGEEVAVNLFELLHA